MKVVLSVIGTLLFSLIVIVNASEETDCIQFGSFDPVSVPLYSLRIGKKKTEMLLDPENGGVADVFAETENVILEKAFIEYSLKKAMDEVFETLLESAVEENAVFENISAANEKVVEAVVENDEGILECSVEELVDKNDEIFEGDVIQDSAKIVIASVIESSADSFVEKESTSEISTTVTREAEPLVVSSETSVLEAETLVVSLKTCAPEFVSETSNVETGKVSSVSVLIIRPSLVPEASIASSPTRTSPSTVSISGDRLAELKKMESILLNRANGLSTIPFSLNLRLVRDYSVGSVKDYSLEALYYCSKYLELPSAEKESPEIKKAYLKSLFDTASTFQPGSKNLSTSLLHPICTDAMKFLADALEPNQINYLLKYSPPVIFENFEVLTGLNDYSFMTMTVYENEIPKSNVRRAIDYLCIPAFVKTAPVDTLMTQLSLFFEPSKHLAILMENRSIDDILSKKEVLENPRYYPFLSWLVESEHLSFKYIADPKFIIAKVRSNGLTQMILSSLIAYIHDNNDHLHVNMMSIAMTWADLHKNLHVTQQHDPESIAKLNEEFNSRSQEALSNLLYFREKRENVNDLIRALEAGEISAHPSMVKVSPDWLKSLKLLAQTPFHLMMRSSFASRSNLAYQIPIHPEDEQNIVKLPRLACVGAGPDVIFDQAQTEFFTSPFVWSSLWRNVFFLNGESWRQEEEFSDLSSLIDFKMIESKLKPHFEIIYRDYERCSVVDLLTAWQKLAPFLSEPLLKGPRLHRFIATISIGSASTGIEISREMEVERKVFAKKIVNIMKESRLIDRAALSEIRSNMSDCADVISMLDTIQAAANENHDSIVAWKTNFTELEGMCELFSRLFLSQSTAIAPAHLFKYLKLMEGAFAALGETLSPDLLAQIGGSCEIMKFLAFHGRAFTRVQIEGLLKSEAGRKFLSTNQKMLHGLSDYSKFSLKDFADLEINTEMIRTYVSSVPSQVKLISLSQKGFASVDDPVALVHSLGIKFWADLNLFKNLSVWELLNPMVLAFEPAETIDAAALIFHMTGIKAKLHDKVSLSVAQVFLTKWIISQDWNAFVYHVIKGRGASVFGSLFIQRLDEIYAKYVIEGEIPGRREILSFFETMEGARGSQDGNLVASLAGLSVAIDSAPLSLFRESINSSESPLSSELASCFETAKYSLTLVHHVAHVIREHFPPIDRNIWFSRLEILNEFNKDGFINSVNARALCRAKLRLLSRTDAVIYKWALELEGVDVERIFGDTSDGPVSISMKDRIGVVPGFKKEEEEKNQSENENEEKGEESVEKKGAKKSGTGKKSKNKNKKKK